MVLPFLLPLLEAGGAMLAGRVAAGFAGRAAAGAGAEAIAGQAAGGAAKATSAEGLAGVDEILGRLAKKKGNEWLGESTARIAQKKGDPNDVYGGADVTRDPNDPVGNVERRLAARAAARAAKRKAEQIAAHAPGGTMNPPQQPPNRPVATGTGGAPPIPPRNPPGGGGGGGAGGGGGPNPGGGGGGLPPGTTPPPGNQNAGQRALNGIQSVAGQAGKVTAAFIVLTTAAKKLGEAQVESQKSLQHFNSQIAFAYARLERGDLMRSRRKGAATADSTQGLVDAMNEMKDAFQPIDSKLTNVFNTIGKWGIQLTTYGLRGVNALLELVGQGEAERMDGTEVGFWQQAFIDAARERDKRTKPKPPQPPPKK